MTAKRVGIVVGAVILVAALLALWFIPLFSLNAKYERTKKMLEEDLGQPFSVRPIDKDIQKTLGVIESTWQCQTEEAPGPHSDAMRLAGIAPNVEGLIQLYNGRMPEFSWLDSSQNRKSLEVAVAQAMIVPMSINKTIYVSADGRLAFVRVTKGTAYIFRENEDGLTETVCVRPTENIEQDAPADADKPRR